VVNVSLQFLLLETVNGGNVVDVKACVFQVHLAGLWQRVQHLFCCREAR